MSLHPSLRLGRLGDWRTSVTLSSKRNGIVAMFVSNRVHINPGLGAFTKPCQFPSSPSDSPRLRSMTLLRSRGYRGFHPGLRYLCHSRPGLSAIGYRSMFRAKLGVVSTACPVQGMMFRSDRQSWFPYPSRR